MASKELYGLEIFSDYQNRWLRVRLESGLISGTAEECYRAQEKRKYTYSKKQLYRIVPV